MDNYKKYFQNYTCPKCRGRSCLTSEVSVSHNQKKFFLAGKNSRFLAVTCSLCGYTEFYNLNVLATQKQEVPKENAAPVVDTELP
ncbi:MAG: zinc ribbon domain-containing protein [bacterium]|jgi:predicted nucleic-acid-binding Zn-ribbon protein